MKRDDPVCVPTWRGFSADVSANSPQPGRCSPRCAASSRLVGLLKISGYLKRAHPDCYARNVSHETIYNTLYAMPRGELRRELIACLRQGHINRWPRSRGTNRKQAGFIAEDVLIHVRPPEVDDRQVPGHWEGDFIKGAANRSAAANGIQVYFADPYSPWQRGSNENANGLVRDYLPKGTDLSGISQDELNVIANRLNERPRRILGHQTPRAVFAKLLADQQANGATT